MSVSGDFVALAGFAKHVEAIAGKGPLGAAFHDGMLKAVGMAALGALDDGFMQSIDPYSRPWKPLSGRSGRPLVDTGRLAASFTQHPTADGFVIETNVAYARTHQLGAGMDGSSIGVIVPVQAKRLAWKPRGSDRMRFAASVRIPRRQMVPTEANGGAGRWGDAINEEAAAFVEDWFHR